MSSDPSTILVVDEDPAIVSLLTQVLKTDGYSVVGSSHPRQALALVAPTASLNMMVLDRTMTGLRAFELIRNAGRSRPELRVLLLADGLDNIVEIRKSDPVLFKPFDISAFSNIVQRTLVERPTIEWTGQERRRAR
jgi:two-component system, cell cycle response regulator CpdR